MGPPPANMLGVAPSVSHMKPFRVWISSSRLPATTSPPKVNQPISLHSHYTPPVRPRRKRAPSCRIRDVGYESPEPKRARLASQPRVPGPHAARIHALEKQVAEMERLVDAAIAHRRANQ